MGPTWGPSGADRTQVGPPVGPWTLISGTVHQHEYLNPIAKTTWGGGGGGGLLQTLVNSNPNMYNYVLMWDEITHAFSNFNDEAWNFIPHFTEHAYVSRQSEDCNNTTLCISLAIKQRVHGRPLNTNKYKRKTILKYRDLSSVYRSTYSGLGINLIMFGQIKNLS